MKIQLHGNAIVITSALKKEAITEIANYNPEALTLYEKVEDKKSPVFVIKNGTNGSFTKNGIVFDDSNEDGFAQTTLVVDLKGVSAEKKVQSLVNEHARTIALANALEDQIKGAAVDITKAREVAKESIEVLGSTSSDEQ